MIAVRTVLSRNHHPGRDLTDVEKLTAQLTDSIVSLRRHLAISGRGFDTHILPSSIYPPGVGSPTPSVLRAVRIDLPNGGSIFVTSTGDIADQGNVDGGDGPLPPSAYLERYSSNNSGLHANDPFLRELIAAITNAAG